MKWDTLDELGGPDAAMEIDLCSSLTKLTAPCYEKPEF